MISSVLLFLINLEIPSKRNVTKTAPIIANNEIVNLSLPTENPKEFNAKTPNATPKVDPEVIPKTEGPARWFRNKVCINKPATEIPAPHKIAVKVLGVLNLKKDSFEKSRDTNTEPNTIPRKNKINSRKTRSIIFFDRVIFKNKIKWNYKESKQDII